MQTLRYQHHSKKKLIIYKKYIFMILWKNIKFCWKKLHLIVGTTQYCDTQQTIHNKTNNTQHKIHSCYIIFLETFFAFIVGTTQYCDTQRTIHNTTNNMQHKIHSCYIISFETFFGRFWRDGLFEVDWFRDRRQLNSLLTATEDGS